MIRRFTLLVAGVVLSASALAAPAQTKFFTSWEDRVLKTAQSQPAWVVPVFAPASIVTQLARFDASRQITSTHTTTWNYGGSKGFQLIPWYKTELDLTLPAYIEHNTKAKDGAGDWQLVLKYRLLAANQKNGNYSVSFAVTGTSPTGSYKNGSPDGSIAPTLIAGKGFGRFDVQSSLGAALPTGHTKTMGRPVTWNTVFQYKVGSYLWPELEFNSTFFHGGANDGRIQTFATPGLMVTPKRFGKTPRNRSAVVLGVGMQIATSSYHSYNHGLLFTGRFVF